MIAAFNLWWDAKAPRERWLLGIAGALAAIVLLVFGIIMPLQRAINSANEAHAIAIDRQAGIAARVAAIRDLERQPRAATTATQANLDIAIAQAAAERGFTLARSTAQGPNAVDMAISNARAPALIAWLADLESAGIIAADLTMRPNADGTIAMTATLRRNS